MLINWHLQGEELKHNITQSLRSLTNTTTHFLIFRFSRSLSHLMVRYVYFWTAGSLSFFCKVQDQFIGFLWRPFQLAPVTKLLNLNAPQSVSLSAVPLGNINIFVYKNHIFNFLFAKIKFLQLNIFLVGSSWNWQTSWLNWQALSNAICFSCEKCKLIFWKWNWIFLYTLFHTIRVSDYWVFTIQSNWCCNVRSNCKLAMLRDFDT